MKIEFYYKNTDTVPYFATNLFIMDNQVYQHSYDTYESQASVISFEDFIEERPDIGWRVIE